MSSSSLIEQGLRHHNAGDLDKAEQCYLDAIAADSRNAEALKLLAVLSFERDRSDDALSYVEAAVSLKPAVPAYRHLQGRILAAQHKFDEAATALEKAAELAENDISIRYDLGLCYESLTRRDEAQAAFSKVLDQAVGHAPALHGLARIAAVRGEAAKAKSYYEQVLALDSANQAARDELAQLTQSRN